MMNFDVVMTSSKIYFVGSFEVKPKVLAIAAVQYRMLSLINKICIFSQSSP